MNDLSKRWLKKHPEHTPKNRYQCWWLSQYLDGAQTFWGKQFDIDHPDFDFLLSQAIRHQYRLDYDFPSPTREEIAFNAGYELGFKDGFEDEGPFV